MSTVSIEGPDGFVAAIPFLLGVHPRRSLIISGLNLDGRVKWTMYLELPAIEPLDVDPSQLVAALAQHQPDRVLMAIVDDRAFDPDCPVDHLEVVDALTAEFADRAIMVQHVVWAEATTPGARCCTDTEQGVVPDAGASPLAVSRVLAGRVTYPDWETLAAEFSPSESEAIERRQDLLVETPCPSSADAVHAIREAIYQAVKGRLPTSDNELAAAAVALTHPHGFSCALQSTADQPGPVRELWIALTRALPAPWNADPAALAALATYLAGQASIAVVGVLLDLAEKAEPGHGLVDVLRPAAGSGMRPEPLIAAVRELAEQLSVIPGED